MRKFFINLVPPRSRTADIHRLSDFPTPQLSLASASQLGGILRSSGFAASAEGDSPDGNPTLMTLKQLFVQGGRVTSDEAARALSPLTLDELIHADLLHEESGQMQSRLQVQSYQGLFLFTDFSHKGHAGEYVLPVGPSGKYLAGLTLRKPVHSTLDLGCGCGLQSLLAARHSKTVIATDINPRALALTRLNADLNGVSNVEVLEGSYFAPVAGRRFDLILANLPYVISPENNLTYRDTPGDAYLHQLIRDIPAYLVEGGFAQLLSNWVHGKEESWWAPLEKTLDELEMDAWLFHNGSSSPEGYADMWLDPQLKNDKRKYARMKEAWVKWYHDQNIEQIALGDIILRRRSSARNWVCSSSVTRSLESPAGEQIARLFEMQDFLAGLPDNEVLLDTALIPVDMDIHPSEDGRSLEASTMSGLYLVAGVSPFTAEVIRGLDGQTSLRAAVEKTGQAAEDVPTFLLEIQTLLGLGMLVPHPPR